MCAEEDGMINGKAVKLHSLNEKIKIALGTKKTNIVHPIIVGFCGGITSNLKKLTKSLISLLGEENVSAIYQDEYYYQGIFRNILENCLVGNTEKLEGIIESENNQLSFYLDELSSGNNVFLPSLDANRRVPNWEVVLSRPIVVVNGPCLFFTPESASKFDFRVFIDSHEKIDMQHSAVQSLAKTMENTKELPDNAFLNALGIFEREYIDKCKKNTEFVVGSEFIFEEFIIDLSAHILDELYVRKKR